MAKNTTSLKWWYEVGFVIDEDTIDAMEACGQNINVARQRVKELEDEFGEPCGIIKVKVLPYNRRDIKRIE